MRAFPAPQSGEIGGWDLSGSVSNLSMFFDMRSLLRLWLLPGVDGSIRGPVAMEGGIIDVCGVVVGPNEYRSGPWLHPVHENSRRWIPYRR